MATAFRLALDAQKHVHGMSDKMGVAVKDESDTVTEYGLKTEEGLRVVLGVLGIGGPLVAALPRKQQEALVKRAIDGPRADIRTVSSSADQERIEDLALPELLRKAFASRLVRGK